MATMATVSIKIEHLIEIANTVEGDYARNFSSVLAFLTKCGENLLREDKPSGWQNINLTKSVFQKHIRNKDMIQLLSAGLQQMGYEELAVNQLVFPERKQIGVMTVSDILSTVEESQNILLHRGVITDQEKRRAEPPVIVPKPSRHIISNMSMLPKCPECGAIQAVAGGIFCERCNAFLPPNPAPFEPTPVFPGPFQPPVVNPGPFEPAPVIPGPFDPPAAPGPNAPAPLIKPPQRKPQSREPEKPSTSKEPLPGSWSCETCTFINEDPNSPICRMCSNHRNPSAASRKDSIVAPPAAGGATSAAAIEVLYEQKRQEYELLLKKMEETTKGDIELYAKLTVREGMLRRELDELMKQIKEKQQSMSIAPPVIDKRSEEPFSSLEEMRKECQEIDVKLAEAVSKDLQLYMSLLDRQEKLKRRISEREGETTTAESRLPAVVISDSRPIESVVPPRPPQRRPRCEECGVEQETAGGLFCEQCEAPLPASESIVDFNAAAVQMAAAPWFESLDPNLPRKQKLISSLPTTTEPTVDPRKRSRAGYSRESVPSTWQCRHCTYINQSSASICEMCSQDHVTFEEPTGSPVAPLADESRLPDPTGSGAVQLVDESDPALNILYDKAVVACRGGGSGEKKLEMVMAAIVQLRSKAQFPVNTAAALLSYIDANGDLQRAYDLLESRNRHVTRISVHYPEVPMDNTHRLLAGGGGNFAEAFSKSCTLEGKTDEEILSMIVRKTDLTENDTLTRLRLMLMVDKQLTESEVKVVFKLVEASPAELSVDELLTIARSSTFDVKRAMELLLIECSLCNGRFPYTRIRTLNFCACKFCDGCMVRWLTSAIREKGVRQWACPLCSKPDLSHSEDAATHYQQLDPMVRQLVPDLYEIFSNKLLDNANYEDPNFRFCAHCNQGFVYQGHLSKKIRCPFCGKYMCYSCKRQWRDQHDGIACDAYELWMREHDPDYQQQRQLDSIIEETGIQCPSCKFRFQLDNEACASVKCSQCEFEFCEGCGLEVVHGRATSQCTDQCKGRGHHAHHPRNCPILTREYDSEDLENLLVMHDIRFEHPLHPPDSTHCVVCNADIAKYQGGLCREHFKQKLCKVIFKHNLDPVDVMKHHQIVTWINQHTNVDFPNDNDSLPKFIKDKFPLK